MATVQVTEKNFETIVKEGIVLLDWWAAWCGPCRAFAPIFEAAAARHPDVVFGKIDTDAEQQLAGAFEIRSIPTLMVLRDGVLLAAQPGMVPGPAIDEMLKTVRALDMVKIKAEIAEQEAAAAAAGDAPDRAAAARGR